MRQDLEKIKIWDVIKRGLRCRCPRCGEGKLFDSWNVLTKRCERCDLSLRNREDETWFFMYLSTAGITGVFIIAMFLFTPANVLLAQFLIGAGAIVVFVITTGPRKGVAIALDYYIDSRSEFPKK